MDATYIQSIPKFDYSTTDQLISQYYLDAAKLSQQPVDQRIDYFSHRFLGKPYLVGALGEGINGRFDQNPLYRCDAFDCLTYVNTVIALAISYGLTEFKKNIIRLNYYNAEPRYFLRHHFVSADWNIQNSEAGIIKDITETIVDDQQKPLFESAETIIDKPSWFSHRKFSDIKLIKPIKKIEAKSLLEELQGLSVLQNKVSASIKYIPINAFFHDNGEPNEMVFAQIPSGAIVEIVRPNWDLTESIGTHLHVSHIGFAIRKDNELLYRQASSVEKRVAEPLLSRYLYQRITSPTIKGVNIHMVC